MHHPFLFVGTHFPLLVRIFFAHLRTVYASPQKLARPLSQGCRNRSIGPWAKPSPLTWDQALLLSLSGGDCRGVCREFYKLLPSLSGIGRKSRAWSQVTCPSPTPARPCAAVDRARLTSMGEKAAGQVSSKHATRLSAPINWNSFKDTQKRHSWEIHIGPSWYGAILVQYWCKLNQCLISARQIVSSTAF